MRDTQARINLESKIAVRWVIQKGSVMNRLMTARRRILLGLVTSLMFSIIAGVSAPQVAQANPPAQSRSLPIGSSLYSFPCEDPANNTPRTFAEGQLSIVNTATGVKTPRGPGITDTDIRNQVGSIAACVTGSTYNYVTKTAYFVTSYAPYNLKSSLFEINLATGKSTFIGPLTPGNSVSGADSQGRIDTWGIATDSTGNMYALWKGISNGQFYVGLVNKATGNLSLIREIQAPWNAYFVREGVSNFSYFNGKFYTASTFQVPLRDSFPHLYEIDVTMGNITSDVAASTSLNWFQGLAIDSNGVIWSSQINFVQTLPIGSWPNATGFQKTSSSYQWWAVSSFIGPTVAPVTSGTAPNSQVATIPAGLTVATIPATTAIPTTSLNFGGSVPTAVTVVPVASNPATADATPFTISGTTKIVDIQITGTFNGSATVCLDGAETDRLFHYTGGAWSELPSRSYSGGQVCGVTTSFSPFVAAPPTQAFLIATDAAAAAAAKAVSDAAAAATAKAAAEAAAARREAEKQAARTDITSKLKNAKDLTVDSFAKAEIFGITAANIAALQNELLALPEASRTDINQVLKVAYKYEVVGNIGSDRVNFMQPNSFVEIGLIPAQSKNKVSLVYAVRKLPESSRDTYAEIQAAIDAETATIKSRKDRLAAIVMRIASR